MYSSVVMGIAGAVIGGMINGIVSSETNSKKIEAYVKAAQDVANATNKYSGEKAYKDMVKQGQDWANQDMASMGSEMAANVYQPENPGTVSTAQSNAMEGANRAAEAVSDTGMQSFGEGAEAAAARNNAKYNAATVAAQQLMNQADINYNVANQAAQAAASGIGQLGKAYNSIAGRKTKNGRPYAGSNNNTQTME